MSAACNSQMKSRSLVHPKITPAPSPAMRDCVVCQLPFYSRSAGNVVCVICKADSDAKFEGEA